MTLHVAVAGWLLGPPSGANRRLLSLLAHAGDRLGAGERITVLHRPDWAPPPLARIAWRPLAIPAAPTWRRARAERAVLPGALAELGADVYDHGFLPLPRLRVPTCLLLHDLRAADGLGPWPRLLARALLRTACRRAAAIVVPSAWTAARLAHHAPDAAAKVAIVPNGVDAPAATAVPPPLRPLPPHGYLLHVGHLEARKHLDVVIDALALLPPDTRPELWLAGHDAGAWAKLARRARRRGVARAVQRLGIVADAELPRLFAHARAVVVPSRYEGFGLPALEGLAHGRPVLASAAGALPEVLGDAGVLLPVDDAHAWATAIATAGDAADERAHARRTRAAHFAWGASAARLLELWRSVAAGR